MATDQPQVNDITFHEVQLFNHLVEIIIYLSRTHQFRSKLYIFSEDISSRIAQLLSAPQKHLKLSMDPRLILNLQALATNSCNSCIEVLSPVYRLAR